MSETATIPPVVQEETKRQPTVYFIDDSATMREVINCPDAASALSQFEQHPPDVVITDVIMPDTDGYSLCSQVKQHPQFGKTPVILMSGVVNKTVADRAVAVQASELVRKPFQPQELIGRVRNLLAPASPAQSEQPAAASHLNSLFAPPPAPRAVPPAPVASIPAPQPVYAEARSAEAAWPRALADAFTPHAAPMGQIPTPTAAPVPRTSTPSVEGQKLRAEIARLELLVKKLQTELQIERQYNQALELQVRTLTQIE
jgi:CheY-like chemotaxis protein